MDASKFKEQLQEFFVDEFHNENRKKFYKEFPIDEVGKIKVSVIYKPASQSMDINVGHEMTNLIQKTIYMKDTSDPYDHIRDIISQLKLYVDEHIDLVSKYRTTIENIKPTPRNFEFTGFKFGKCSYANLGKIRYAYMAVNAPYMNNQWFKVYFKPDDIMWNKTREELVKHRKTIVHEDNRGDIPPNVWLLDTNLETQAWDYCMKNERNLLEKLLTIPLNKLDIREDDSLNVLIMNRIGNCLYSCVKGDLANPTNDLYLVIYHGIYNKKTSGFCKKIGSTEPPHIIYEEQPQYNCSSTKIELDKASLINCNYNNMNPQHLLKEIPPQDQYLDYLFDTYLKEWSEKCSIT